MFGVTVVGVGDCCNCVGADGFSDAGVCDCDDG